MPRPGLWKRGSLETWQLFCLSWMAAGKMGCAPCHGDSGLLVGNLSGQLASQTAFGLSLGGWEGDMGIPAVPAEQALPSVGTRFSHYVLTM